MESPYNISQNQISTYRETFSSKLAKEAGLKPRYGEGLMGRVDREKEKEFFLDCVPQLFPLFLSRWTSGRGFEPCEVLERQEETDNVDNETRSITKYDLFRPTSLGLTEKLGKRELGYLPILGNSFIFMSSNHISYDDIFSEALRRAFEHEIKTNMRENYVHSTNNVTSDPRCPNSIKLEFNGINYLLNRWKDCSKYDSHFWLALLDDIGLRDIPFRRFARCCTKDQRVSFDRMIGNWTSTSWMTRYGLRIIFPDVELTPEIERLSRKVETLGKEKETEQVLDRLQGLKEHVDEYNLKHRAEMERQVGLITEDLADQELSDIEKELEGISILSDLPMDSLYGQHSKITA